MNVALLLSFEPRLFILWYFCYKDVDYEKYPNFVKAEGYHLILNPGEMLYIPPGNLCILLYLRDLDYLIKTVQIIRDE